MKQIMTLAAVMLFAAQAAEAACSGTTFTPQRTAGWQYLFPATPSTHNALYITDPANEQYAVFDLEWGGTLASLRYKAGGGILQTDGTAHPASQELVWGHDPGAMAQTAMWIGNGHYNPTMAGDPGDVIANEPDKENPVWYAKGAPVYGAACKNGNTLVIYSTTADFAKNDAYWGIDKNFSRAAAIKQGRPIADMWFTPYSITFTVTFVANPGGAPAYYMKLDHYIQNTDVREDLGGAHWSFALYAPGTTDAPDANNEFNPQTGANSFRYAGYEPAGCVPSGTNPLSCTPGTKLVAGLYPNSGLTGGIAVSTKASAYFPSSTVGQTAQRYDGFWNNVALDIGAENVALAPGTGRRIVVYVMAGDFSSAKAFAPQ